MIYRQIGIKVTNIDSNQSYLYDEVERFTTIGPIEIDSMYIAKGQPSPGETISLHLPLKKKGSLATATNVTLKFNTFDTCAVYFPSIYPNSYGDIPACEVVDISREYTIRFNDDCNADWIAYFVVEIYSNDHFYWSSTFSILTGIELEEQTVPNVFSLSQNYPNPFNPSTMINYQFRGPERL